MFLLNYSKFKNPTVVKKYLQYEYELIKWKRNKLKLGKVKFEYSEVKYGSIVLKPMFNMVFSNQPSYSSTKQRFLSMYESTEWNWDLKNVLAFLLIVVTLVFVIKNYLKSLISYYFSSFCESTESYETLLRFTLDMTLSSKLTDTSYVQQLVQILSENIVDFCIYFNFII